jgi:CMP-N-acetylneuraminic acid synthetase
MIVYAIIPARGGSKGLPEKNLQVCGGKTLLQRAIETCQRAKYVDAVYVSSDDYRIQQHAAEHGAIVIERPLPLATDDATSTDVLLHAVETMPHPVRPDIIAFVQCTAPLMTPHDVDDCIRLLDRENCDVCIAAVPNHEMLVQARYAGRIVGHGYDLTSIPTNRQQRRPTWSIAGSVWAIQTGPFLRRRTLYTDNCCILEVDRKLDIDTAEDLRLAELLLAESGRHHIVSRPA